MCTSESSLYLAVNYNHLNDNIWYKKQMMGNDRINTWMAATVSKNIGYELLASERSERDTYRGNTIENWGCLLASERSERDSIRGG